MSYIEDFKTVLIIREMQPRTVDCYISQLRSYLDWCENRNPKEITPQEFNQWIASANCNASIRQRKGLIRNFYEYVLGQGFKCLYLPPTPRKKTTPEWLTPIEIEAIFSAIRNKKQRTILKFQYACALRVSEVVNIKRSDFIKHHEPHLNTIVYDLRIKGKGGKVRTIPVPDDTIQEIFSYWNWLEEKPKEYLFPGQQRNTYSVTSAQQVMKRAMRQCEIKKKGNTHLLRHSRITHLIQNGVDIAFVQKLAGHASIKTTEIYLHLTTSDMRIAFSKADSFIKQEVRLLKSA